MRPMRARNICDPRAPGQFPLHLNMAEEYMDIFERDKLPAVASVEQVTPCPTSLPDVLIH